MTRHWKLLLFGSAVAVVIAVAVVRYQGSAPQVPAAAPQPAARDRAHTEGGRWAAQPGTGAGAGHEARAPGRGAPPADVRPPAEGHAALPSSPDRVRVQPAKPASDRLRPRSALPAPGSQPQGAEPQAAGPEWGEPAQAGALDEWASEAHALLADSVYSSGPEESFPTNSQVDVGALADLNAEEGTIAFWFQPEWSGANHDDAFLIEVGDGRILVHKNVNFLRVELVDGDGEKGGTGANLNDWEPGQAHQVAVIWGQATTTGQLVASLVVDGKVVGQRRYQKHVAVDSETPLAIGSNFPPGRPVAPGVISKVQVSNRALTVPELARLFELGRAAQEQETEPQAAAER